MAVGDALGAPLENMKAGYIEQVYGAVTNYVDTVAAFPDQPKMWRLKGLYGSDTQQALALAEVLAMYGEADTRALADLFARLYREGDPDLPLGAHRNPRKKFRKAVEMMVSADDALTCGQPSPGNGAAARIAPIGLFMADDDALLGQAVIDTSLITHHDCRAISGALAMAYAVSRLVQPDGEEAIPQLLEELSPWVRDWESELANQYADILDNEETEGRPLDYLHDFSRALDVVAPLVREGNDDLAAKSILAAANNAHPNRKIANPQTSFAPASVLMALYRGLSACSFDEGMRKTINAGGDTDTMGAMVGALLGARFGYESIPEEWRDELMQQEFILSRAQALCKREIDWNFWDDFIETEKTLTERASQSLVKAKGANRKIIDKRKGKISKRKERQAQKKPEQDLGFAPPPELWVHSDIPISPAYDPDPIQAKKDRAKRGRKRIDWKEERKRKIKEEWE